MAKLLGYLIGGLFILLFIVPIPVTGWLFYDRVERLVSGTSLPATVTTCYRQSRSSGGRSKVSYGPVAVTEEGVQVRGDFRWSRKNWCEWALGDQVTVLINPDGDHRIHSFLQFWALPSLFALICGVFYPLGYRAKKRKDAEQKASE